MELAPRPFTEPSLSRLPVDAEGRDEILAAHAAALAVGEDGYFDPISGLWVFTAAYLASRDCCDNKCRHCPYVD